MEQIFSVNVKNVGESSAIWVKVSYEKRRSGTTQQYRFQFQEYLSNRSGNPSSSPYYQNNLRSRIFLDGVKVWEYNYQNSSRGWSFTQTTDWFDIPNKIDGTTPIFFTVKDTINSSWTDYTSNTYQLPIDTAGSILTFEGNFEETYNTASGTYTANLTKPISSYVDDLYIFGSFAEYSRFVGGDTTSYTKKIQNLLGGDFTFSFSANDINHIASLNTTESSDINIYLINYTYTDSSRTTELMHSTQIPKMEIQGLEPTILLRIFNDTTTQSITGNTSTTCSNFVKGKTKINVSYTIDLKGGATIVSASIGGINVQPTNNIVSLNNIIQNDLSLNIIDSRGNTLTYSKVLTLKDYFEIGYEGSSKRNQPTNNKIDIILNGQFWNNNFGATDNELTIKYKIWEKDTEEPTSWTGTLQPTITQNNFIVNYTTDAIYDYRKIYQLKVSIEDKVMVIYPQKTISKGIPVFWWTEDDFHIGTSDTQSKLFLNGQEIGNISFPIGYVYISTENTSPASLFGGTWEQLKDKFLLGAGDTYTAGTTGGEETHLLTANESGLRSHEHKMRGISTRQSGNWNGVVASAGTSDTNWSSVISVAGQDAIEPHNNMPPYLVVYMWKRIS